MARHRHDLPQLDGSLWLTDSGLETDLVFHGGFDLPCFAAFPLLRDGRGRASLVRYFESHAELAARTGFGIVLETPTWRADRAWGARLGCDEAALRAINEDAVQLLVDVRERVGGTVVVSGCAGPRGDGYAVDERMTADEAHEHHAAQVQTFAGTEVDLVTAMTLTYADEAIGFVRAARDVGVPAVVSFTVETDGRLPDGTSLAQAVQEVDRRTDAAAAYFAVNCAHPTHVAPALSGVGERVLGVRANASRASHAELDEAEVLDEGDPQELGAQLADLHREHPSLRILGGCCGTDLRHVAALADRLA